MAKRRRNPAIVQQDDDTSDLDVFHSRSDNYPEKPVQRNAANARERARMRVLSRAFCRLKTSLPMVPPDTKLSKLDTLRLAATYISHLRKVLREDAEDGSAQVMPSNTRNCATHPVTLTWPFTFNSRPTYGDYSSVPSMTENNRRAEDFGHDTITDYREFVPCDYIAMNHTDYHIREPMEHYLDQ